MTNYDKVLRRLLTLITLNVDYRGPKFRDRIELAILAEMAGSGIPEPVARLLAIPLGSDIIERLEKDRNTLIYQAEGIAPTPECDCARCTVVAWAAAQEIKVTKEQEEQAAALVKGALENAQR